MGSINQAMLDALRGMNTRTATVDPNAPIPRPGQPTNTQIAPMLGNMGAYVNQDVNAFNAQQTVPGTWNGQPIQNQPTSTNVAIPGYGNVPINHSMGMSDAAFNGTPPPSASGWHPTNTRALFGQLISQYMNESTTPQQWAGLLQQQGQAGQQQQAPYMPNGMYGRQAMQLAGTYSPNTPPGDTYPNGLLGGKGGGFRPGGK